MAARTATRWRTGVVAAGEDTFTLRAGHLAETEPRRPVLLSHGADGQEFFFRFSHILDAASSGRYTLIAGDFGGARHFGNDVHIARVDATLAWARAQGIATNAPPVTVGWSMGNLILNWVRTHQADHAGHLSVSGLYDLAALHSANRAGLAPSIDAAHGGPVHGPDHDPAVYVADITGVPIIAWHATDDTLTPPADEAAFAADHGNITRLSLGDVGHGNFPALPDGAFLAALDQLTGGA